MRWVFLQNCSRKFFSHHMINKRMLLLAKTMKKKTGSSRRNTVWNVYDLSPEQKHLHWIGKPAITKMCFFSTQFRFSLFFQILQQIPVKMKTLASNIHTAFLQKCIFLVLFDITLQHRRWNIKSAELLSELLWNPLKLLLLNQNLFLFKYFVKKIRKFTLVLVQISTSNRDRRI